MDKDEKEYRDKAIAIDLMKNYTDILKAIIIGIAAIFSFLISQWESIVDNKLQGFIILGSLVTIPFFALGLFYYAKISSYVKLFESENTFIRKSKSKQ